MKRCTSQSPRRHRSLRVKINYFIQGKLKSDCRRRKSRREYNPLTHFSLPLFILMVTKGKTPHITSEYLERKNEVERHKSKTWPLVVLITDLS